jgi:purine-nucleoside phosphorylase
MVANAAGIRVLALNRLVSIRPASGILAVEMEAAALYTFARKRNKAVHVSSDRSLILMLSSDC